MSCSSNLKKLVTKDPKADIEICYKEKKGDPLHVERKKQQRAICDELIFIAIAYGLKKRTYQDWSYTITDRSIKGTMYEKYTDKLRGLTVIGSRVNNIFYIKTTFWNFLIKARKRF